jgi:penicillin-binding protein 2
MTILLAIGCMIGLLAVAVLKLVTIQLKSGSHYRQEAINNQTREIYSYAPRGLIKDRDGQVLVSNETITQLAVVPHLWVTSGSGCNAYLKQVAGLIGQSPKTMQELINNHGDDYAPQLLSRSLSRSQTLVVAQLQSQCPALVLSQIASRHYVTGEGLAQILGYVGQPSSQDLKNIKDLLPSDFIGKTGIEESYDRDLRGQDGLTRLQVDSLGRVKQTLSDIPPQNGQSITLNIDEKLQQTLAISLKQTMQKVHSNRSAAVAMDPQTGQILALVSLPEYNNNLFSGGITTQQYQKLLNDPLSPLVDTAVSGGFPSGSIIKPVIASAGLQTGVITPNTIITDHGFISVPSAYDPSVTYRFNGWDPSGLGPLNVVRAIAMSSDIFFYTVGGGYGNQPGLGAERLAQFYRLFGLGSPTGIDLPFDSTGRVPDPAFKEKAYHQPWYIGDTYNISIGQGDLLVSPLQITLADAATINGGKLLEPHVVKSVGQKEIPTKVIKKLPIDQKYLDLITEGMRQTISDGTVSPALFKNVPGGAGGKSGTAEAGEGEEPHAWFVGFAPAHNPKIIITVFIDHGGEGSTWAAPIVASGLENYLKNP